MTFFDFLGDASAESGHLRIIDFDAIESIILINHCGEDRACKKIQMRLKLTCSLTHHLTKSKIIPKIQTFCCRHKRCKPAYPYADLTLSTYHHFYFGEQFNRNIVHEHFLF